MSDMRMFILHDTEFRWHFAHIPLVLMNVTHNKIVMTSGPSAQVRECLSFQARTPAFEPFQGKISSWMFCCIRVEFNIWPREWKSSCVDVVTSFELTQIATIFQHWARGECACVFMPLLTTQFPKNSRVYIKIHSKASEDWASLFEAHKSIWGRKPQLVHDST